MDKYALWKWLGLIAAICISIAIVYPISEKVNLGLDLQGGTSFLLEVDTEKLEGRALDDVKERALEIIRNRVDALGIAEPIIYAETGNNRIVVQMPGLSIDNIQRTRDIIKKAAFLEFRMVHPKNDELIAKVYESGKVPPGYSITREDEVIGTQVRTHTYLKRDESKDQGLSWDKIKERVRTFQSPAGYEFMLRKVDINGKTVFEPYYVSRRRARELTGEYVKDASIERDQINRPYVILEFDGKGAKKFASVTQDYAPGGQKNPNPQDRRYLAIILDGALYSAPYIREPIFGGRASITGDFTEQEAQDLSLVLRAGSLPVPINIVEERTVDPTLGQDSINSGKQAAIIALIAVMIFMILYYLMAGVIANMALILNLILLPLGMMFVSGMLGLFDRNTMMGGPLTLPTLTLPGIAGIVLVIGMAVDANVLIFERMREEQKAGKRLSNIISAGYDKALSAILDSNVTTLLVGAIMFVFGSGAVRGYAVTLCAGIIISMYTAIIVTRMIFSFIAGHTNISSLKMLSVIKDTSIDFIGKRYIALVLSLAIIIGTGVLFVKKGNQNLGVDFSSGVALTVDFQEKQPVEQIRAALTTVGIKDAFIQYQREMSPDAHGEMAEFLYVKVPFSDGESADKALTESFSGFKVVMQESVDPQIGKEFAKQSIKAVVIALIGMVIYITLRFEFAFSMGALIALLHDALVTVGLYCAFGRQLSLPIVAGVLTIIGYSINDTIVIFDRIREDLRLYRGKQMSFKDVANLSINQTLSRTVLTSFTSLLSAGALLIFGGGAINDFALVLVIGIITGTYSTIFIATPIVLLWHREKKISQ